MPALVTVTVGAEPAGRVTVDTEATGQVDMPALVTVTVGAEPGQVAPEVLMTVTVDTPAEPKAEGVTVIVEAVPWAHVAAG